MTEFIRSAGPLGQPEDDAARDARHQVLTTLLGAYADGELPVETSSQIDAHLLGCARCRSELRVQQAVSQRLSRSTMPAATAALQDRIRAMLAATPAPVREAALVTRPAAHRRQRMLVSGVVAALALLATAIAVRDRAPRLDPAPLVVGPSNPALEGIFAEYRRVSQLDLPGRARDLEAVRRALPFPVRPIAIADAHLLAAWTTDLEGEPAAVLAYRWKEQVILQYIVSETALFRARELRVAFAGRRAVVAQDGAQGLIAWPDASAGSVLVGDVPWAALVPLTRARMR